MELVIDSVIKKSSYPFIDSLSYPSIYQPNFRSIFAMNLLPKMFLTCLIVKNSRHLQAQKQPSCLKSLITSWLEELFDLAGQMALLLMVVPHFVIDHDNKFLASDLRQFYDITDKQD